MLTSYELCCCRSRFPSGAPTGEAPSTPGEERDTPSGVNEPAALITRVRPRTTLEARSAARARISSAIGTSAPAATSARTSSRVRVTACFSGARGDYGRNNQWDDNYRRWRDRQIETPLGPVDFAQGIFARIAQHPAARRDERGAGGDQRRLRGHEHRIPNNQNHGHTQQNPGAAHPMITVGTTG